MQIDIRSPSTRNLELDRRCSCPSPRSAFTYIEVLFAVMILGIGMIMVSALFVVALHQVDTTGDDTAACTLASSVFATLSQQMTSANTPSTTGGVRAFASVKTLWDVTAGEMISRSNREYACAPLYRLNEGESVAQVTLILLRSFNRPQFDPGVDLAAPPDSDSPATLEPRGVKIRLFRDSFGQDCVAFPQADSPNVAAAAPGAYLVTSDAGSFGETCGRSVRLSSYVGLTDGESVWTLMPGSDLQTFGADFPKDPMAALLVGRGLADPANPSKGYAGPAQDVSLFTGYVTLK